MVIKMNEILEALKVFFKTVNFDINYDRIRSYLTKEGKYFSDSESNLWLIGNKNEIEFCIPAAEGTIIGKIIHCRQTNYDLENFFINYTYQKYNQEIACKENIIFDCKDNDKLAKCPIHLVSRIEIKDHKAKTHEIMINGEQNLFYIDSENAVLGVKYSQDDCIGINYFNKKTAKSITVNPNKEFQKITIIIATSKKTKTHEIDYEPQKEPYGLTKEVWEILNQDLELYNFIKDTANSINLEYFVNLLTYAFSILTEEEFISLTGLIKNEEISKSLTLTGQTRKLNKNESNS